MLISHNLKPSLKLHSSNVIESQQNTLSHANCTVQSTVCSTTILPLSSITKIFLLVSTMFILEF